MSNKTNFSWKVSKFTCEHIIFSSKLSGMMIQIKKDNDKFILRVSDTQTGKYNFLTRDFKSRSAAVKYARKTFFIEV
jgi:hypothetical protein